MPARSTRNSSTRQVAREAVARRFAPLLEQLTVLEQAANPDGLNLHWDPLPIRDTALFAQLCELARRGLLAVRAHRRYFLRHDLYDDGMYWYRLCVLISGAALACIGRSETHVPNAVTTRITLYVMELSEFTVLRGDMLKRNYEAAGNLLLAFDSESLRLAILSHGKKRRCRAMSVFARKTVERIDRLKSKSSSGP